MEDSMLQQRAKLRWFKHGDKCSKVFFRKINATRAKQRVFQISNAAGDTLIEADQVMAEFLSFYESLLGGVRHRRALNLGFLEPHLKHMLSIEDANELILPITPMEIKEAFFGISEDSAPGPYEYTSTFFKATWSEIGDDICAAVAKFFVSGRLLKKLNATLLVLIPKVQLPIRVSEFRPIACCNVVYKAISKILWSSVFILPKAIIKVIEKNEDVPVERVLWFRLCEGVMGASVRTRAQYVWLGCSDIGCEIKQFSRSTLHRLLGAGGN
ncbi:UNVERIFIED_CONTAM: hypothetical protein Sradi_6871400 [Sesamum radiatum]|uniref:Uncharacterized protein n=1 Tax=Sesamum radiatum TaxID=300843 RepID=A0AAW2JK58_SESRA